MLVVCTTTPATRRLPRLYSLLRGRLRTRRFGHALHLRPFTFALRSLTTGEVEVEVARLVLLCGIGLMTVAESRKDAALLRLRLLSRLIVQSDVLEGAFLGHAAAGAFWAALLQRRPRWGPRTAHVERASGVE